MNGRQSGEPATMSVENQVDELERCVDAFANSIASLEERRLFETVTGSWSARDIVAHLIGWNRNVVRGASQILCGELPFYDVDPGPNYASVNASLVREIDDTDRSLLLEKLAASTGELTAFLRTVDPGAWDHDFGVRHERESLTVKSTVDDLIADYHHHRVQLEQFQATAE